MHGASRSGWGTSGRRTAMVFAAFLALLAGAGAQPPAATPTTPTTPTTPSGSAEQPLVYVCPPCGCGSDSKTFDRPGVCPSCGMGLVRKTPPRPRRNVAVVMFDGVEILDFAGPAEVFSVAMGPNGNEFEVFTVAATTEPIESRNAVLNITPEYTIANCPKPDVVVVPGGGVGALNRDERMLEWLKQRAGDSEIVMSVCNGAFVLAKAELLDGLEATTHMGAVERLRKEAPKARVVSERRFVDNGKIITSAGVSAGIDAALHVVGRLVGPEAAEHTANYMQYERRGEK